MRVHEPRASSILYNLLRSHESEGRFLLPANVCPVVPLTFRRAGRSFDLVDISRDTLALDQFRCLSQVREDPGTYAGVLFVHPYGAEVEVGSFFQELKEVRQDLLLIDDRCLCRPELERTPAEAHAVLYSTGHAKPVDLRGGGYGFLADNVAYCRHPGSYRAESLAKVTAQYKKALSSRKPLDKTVGQKDWLDLSSPRVPWPEYRGMILRQRARVDEHRKNLNTIYTETIPEEFRLADRFQSWRFHVLVLEPDRLVSNIRDQGALASRHYQPLGGIFAHGEYPVAEKLHSRVVNLFNDLHCSRHQAEVAAKIVERHVREHAEVS